MFWLVFLCILCVLAITLVGVIDLIEDSELEDEYEIVYMIVRK
jgi:hypothetical protein